MICPRCISAVEQLFRSNVNKPVKSEIAFNLGCSSVSHLSAQFKKVTGLTSSLFKAMGIRLSKSLDDL